MSVADGIAAKGVAAWHDYINDGNQPAALSKLIADDAVFHSPVMHSAQMGREKVFAYLHAAAQVLGQDGFEYVRQIIDGDQAMLEFAVTIDDIYINGVDIIRFNAEAQIVDFKVMIRPAKALNLVREKMGAMLQK